MRPFLDEDFLLTSDTARYLYHQVAERLPILDYHCHVSPREIAEDRIFHNLTQLWLEGDHYKWRLMRANGVDERYITGDAGDYEKFEAWAGAVEQAVGNPLYHWSHLELRRYFGYTGHLTAANARQVWEHCSAVIGGGLSVREILRKSNVTLLCTTDDPADTLEWHQRLAADHTLETKVLPAFRPDKAVNVEKEDFPDYLARLSAAAGVDINGWGSLLAALDNRMDFFAQHGCKVSDHGLDNLRYAPARPEELDSVVRRRLAGETVTEEEVRQYKWALLTHLARGYAKRDWAMQLHFAAQRDNNHRMHRLLGPDTGYDSIGPGVNLPALAAFLDGLDETGGAAPHHPLFPGAQRQRRAGGPDGLLPGARYCGEATARLRLVVQRPQAGDGGPAYHLGRRRLAGQLYRDAHRFPQLPVLHPARVLSTHPLQPYRPVGGGRRIPR